MHRYRFVLYRPFQLIPVLFGISVLSFFMVKLIPGDPVRAADVMTRWVNWIDQYLK